MPWTQDVVCSAASRRLRLLKMRGKQVVGAAHSAARSCVGYLKTHTNLAWVC